MRKVFHFDVPRERYVADAAVITCFDHRFQLAYGKFLKRLGLTILDPIKLAGGPRSLASPDREAEREVVLEQIRASIRLHETRLVILFMHSDCGACGGIEAFGGDFHLEAQRAEEDLRDAADCLRKAIPAVDVQAYFFAFDGAWSVDLAPQAAGADPHH